MQKLLSGLTGLALAVLGIGAANAQDTVKIGIINEYSGQFADTGNQIDNGIKLYVKQHGDTVAGKKIELIRKDTGGIAPDVAKRLSQEAIVRDGADILAGFSLTPIMGPCPRSASWTLTSTATRRRTPRTSARERASPRR